MKPIHVDDRRLFTSLSTHSAHRSFQSSRNITIRWPLQADSIHSSGRNTLSIRAINDAHTIPQALDPFVSLLLRRRKSRRCRSQCTKPEGSIRLLVAEREICSWRRSWICRGQSGGWFGRQGDQGRRRSVHRVSIYLLRGLTAVDRFIYFVAWLLM